MERRVNLVAGALSGPHFNVRTMMPVLLATLAVAGGFTDGQLGDLGAAYSVGATVTALTSPYWMRAERVSLPAVCLTAVGVATFAMMSTASSFPTLLAAFFVAGVGFGGVYALMIAWLGRTPDPDRAYGWQWCIGSIPGIALIFVVGDAASSGAGLGRPLLVLAAANAVLGLACLLLPARLPPAEAGLRSRPDRGAAGLPARASVALTGLFSIYLGTTGVWSFLGRIATTLGMSSRDADAVLAIAAATAAGAGLLVGEVPAIGAGRASMAVTVAVMTGGLALMAASRTPLGFGTGATLLIGLSTVALTLATARAARLGEGRTAGGLPAAALGLGSIAGPALAGRVFERFGTCGTLAASGVALGLGLLAYTLAGRVR